LCPIIANNPYLQQRKHLLTLLIMAATFTLEICTDSIASALAAAQGGAHRLELCAALPVGGLTPSAGLIALVREKVTLPLHVLVRPRSGDFFYSAEEFAVMRQDVLTAKALGADGVVLGLLLPDGRIDVDRTRELTTLARPLSVTFHRAFDVAADPFGAFNELLALGIDRLLTSGQQPSALLGAALLALLVKRGGDRLSIMPGAGINENNIERLVQLTGAQEYHMSLSQNTSSPMTFRRPEVSMGGTLPESEYEHYQADASRIRQVLEILQQGPMTNDQ
jgi:copper homeostasis protein